MTIQNAFYENPVKFLKIDMRIAIFHNFCRKTILKCYKMNQFFLKSVRESSSELSGTNNIIEKWLGIQGR